MPATPRTDLLGLTFAELRGWARDLVGFADRHHAALHRQVAATGRFAPHELPEWQEAERGRPGTLATLAAAAAEDQMPSVSRAESAHDPQHGTTTKLALRFADGREAEAVLIPMRGDHVTVCVSSQVGCRMGCAFCRTARMGLVRNLAAHEIVGQVVAAARHAGAAPRNVVFMGMGEPLDNLEAVARAVACLAEPRGCAIPGSRITISTVGRADQIPRLGGLGLGACNLAISVSSADDALRDRLMPVNRTHDLAALRAALAAHPLPRGRKLLIAYVLMAGVNDADADAHALADWIGDLEAMVNLIPFNAFAGSPWQPSPIERVVAFQAALRGRGLHALTRTTRGDAVLAACGQLGTGKKEVSVG
ncbi:MAG TPA: radical SAM protein [Planctomycetota bacterium]|nr:radical SAM protein [Planctomycetota bacterium]